MIPKYYGDIIENIKQNKKINIKTFLIIFLIFNILILILSYLDGMFFTKLQKYLRMDIIKSVLENYKGTTDSEISNIISSLVRLPVIVKELGVDIRTHIIPD